MDESTLKINCDLQNVFFCSLDSQNTAFLDDKTKKKQNWSDFDR